MRGVLSLLGLDQASLAVVRMRDMVERLLVGEVAPEERQQVLRSWVTAWAPWVFSSTC